MQVEVITTDSRGFTPEELSDRCAKKIVSVADTAPPAIRDQAHAFQSAVEATVTFTCTKLLGMIGLRYIMLC